VRSALQHAASVGSLMITTAAMVAERREKPFPDNGSHGDDSY
jgi:chaperonin GroEL (HSP60 family)